MLIICRNVSIPCWHRDAKPAKQQGTMIPGKIYIFLKYPSKTWSPSSYPNTFGFLWTFVALMEVGRFLKRFKNAGRILLFEEVERKGEQKVYVVRAGARPWFTRTAMLMVSPCVLLAEQYLTGRCCQAWVMAQKFSCIMGPCKRVKIIL